MGHTGEWLVQGGADYRGAGGSHLYFIAEIAVALFADVSHIIPWFVNSSAPSLPHLHPLSIVHHHTYKLHLCLQRTGWRGRYQH